MNIDQKMEQRITVRLTDDELRATERAAIAEGDRKVSTLLRRALVLFLRSRGYISTFQDEKMQQNVDFNPATPSNAYTQDSRSHSDYQRP
jgi:intergrase/recombinase